VDPPQHSHWEANIVGTLHWRFGETASADANAGRNAGGAGGAGSFAGGGSSSEQQSSASAITSASASASASAISARAGTAMNSIRAVVVSFVKLFGTPTGAKLRQWCTMHRYELLMDFNGF
jgi:hypothetical protein